MTYKYTKNNNATKEAE